MKKFFLIIGVVLIAFTSCEKDKPDTGGTNMEAFANEWWVQLYDPAGALVYPDTYHGHIATYNTAANNNEFWIDDQAEIWDFKVKAQGNLSDMSFNALQAQSVVEGYEIIVNITNGKILRDAGRSRTGVVTDSIYMDIEFEDDPGVVYSIRGHARTRFAEDDY